MKIEVTSIGRLVNGNHMASVIVFDADNGVEAKKAIENTEPKGETWQAFSDMKRVNEKLGSKITSMKIASRDLKEQNEKLGSKITSMEIASDAQHLANMNLQLANRDLKEENETLMHNNKELLHQLNTIGNNICKLANDLDDTNYVPFYGDQP